MYRIVRNGSGAEVIRRHRAVSRGCPEYLTFPALTATGMVGHLFTTRTGGVSTGDCATMNLSFTRGEDRETVLENYRRICEAMGVEPEDVVASMQTHTTNIRHVTEADKGKGVVRPQDYSDIDGLITDEPGVVLACYFADCVPLYFVDPVRRAIGLAHSGRMGTAQGMGARMVESMRQTFGSSPADLVAAIGPSICRDCYEVGEDVAEEFRQKFEDERVLRPGRAAGKYQLDLWLANRLILLEAGIPEDRIYVTDICTCHNPEYLFSHRASHGRRGNLAAFLFIRKS
ncbi:MAG: peptidoglycan editing factor PgeF [Clostridium sp.]|nr:peptidoglycan editing factor PgeF [Acetatifactor muris]MCM1564234.1 peptidoglycan editing factor PgeF [Clostridium sp.]